MISPKHVAIIMDGNGRWRIKKKKSRNFGHKNCIKTVENYFKDKKIHTSVHFKPLHKYTPLLQNRDYPVADTEWGRFITLPCHNRMVEEDIDYVIYWVNEYFNKKG